MAETYRMQAKMRERLIHEAARRITEIFYTREQWEALPFKQRLESAGRILDELAGWEWAGPYLVAYHMLSDAQVLRMLRGIVKVAESRYRVGMGRKD